MRHGRWSGSAAINKGYETAGFGTKTAVGADARRQQWMPERFFDRSISIAPGTILVQQKSIWREMFEHSVTEKVLEFLNGFCCARNDSGTGKIDLV